MRRILVCGLAAAWFCRGIPPVSVEVPIARLLRNLGAYVEANPKDAEGHYLLGRLHASAFLFGVTKQLRVAADKDGRMLPFQLPWLSPRAPILRPRKNLDKTLSEEDRYHLASAVREYRLAIELSSDQPVAYKLTAADTYLRPSNKPLAYLGLGWILEQAAAFRRDDRSSWIEQALDSYRKCYALGRGQPADDPDERATLDVEAADGIIRILRQRIPREGPGFLARVLGLDPYARERAELAAMESATKKRAIWVSPIIFPLGRYTDYESLLDPRRRVWFDLEGTGAPACWPWLTPETGILVWDPGNTGRITSGRQLFGSVTWWVFWTDGYQALSALDDNRDGWLSGLELAGIAVWRDANSNGVSEPGEVVRLDAMRITRIGVQPNRTVQGVPAHKRGVEFADGSAVPSYDWMPVRDTPSFKVRKQAEGMDPDCNPALRSGLLRCSVTVRTLGYENPRRLPLLHRLCEGRPVCAQRGGYRRELGYLPRIADRGGYVAAARRLVRLR